MLLHRTFALSFGAVHAVNSKMLFCLVFYTCEHEVEGLEETPLVLAIFRA